MDRFLIISAHTAEDCKMAIKHFQRYHAGFLTNFEWGCSDHDHHAYALIEAPDHETAILSVPPLFREKAKAIQLVRFETKDMAEKDPLHEEVDY